MLLKVSYFPPDPDGGRQGTPNSYLVGLDASHRVYGNAGRVPDEYEDYVPANVALTRHSDMDGSYPIERLLDKEIWKPR